MYIVKSGESMCFIGEDNKNKEFIDSYVVPVIKKINFLVYQQGKIKNILNLSSCSFYTSSGFNYLFYIGNSIVIYDRSTTGKIEEYKGRNMVIIK